MSKNRKQVSFTLDENLMNELKEYCIENGYDYSVMLEMIIENYLPND